MKLRHSRKFWYFFCTVVIVALADSNPQGDETYRTRLLEAFGKSLVRRLFDALPANLHGSAGRIVESFAWFLEFMADPARRERLRATTHEGRYAPELDNPFPATKFNSDLLHQGTVLPIDDLPASQRDRILSRFLLRVPASRHWFARIFGL